MGLKDESTQDIQWDLAMFYADREKKDKYAVTLRKELERRGEKKPINCRWICDSYAAFGKSLRYELKDKGE